MSAITDKEIFGNFLPFPSIKSITLETGGIEVKERNPHIEEDKKADGTSTGYGSPKYAEKSGKLKIAVSAVVKDTVSHEELSFGSQWATSDALKFIKFTVIQLESANVTNMLLKDSSLAAAMAMPVGTVPWDKVSPEQKLFVSIYKGLIADKGYIKTTSLAASDLDAIQTQTYVNDHGDTVTEYALNYIFNLNDEAPSHLSYFCVATLDFDSLGAELDLEPSDILDSIENLGELTEVSHVVAIDGGKVTSLQNKFFLKDGTPYDGPAHYHPQEGWMAGSYHTNEPHPKLDVKKVTNNSVRDFRSSKNEDIDLSLLYEYDSLINSLVGDLRVTSYKHQDLKKKSYIYDCVSYTEPKMPNNGGLVAGCGIFFMLDLASILRDNSALPGMYKKNNLQSKFTTSSKIRNLKLFTRQIEESETINELGVKNNKSYPVVPNSIGQNIARFSDKGEQVNITEHELFFETAPFHFVADHVRAFTAKHSIERGQYEYFLEIEIEDGAVKYLANKLDKLYDLLDQLNVYYNDATRSSLYTNDNGDKIKKSNFNIYLNKFTKEWINKNKNLEGSGSYKSIKKSIEKNLVDIYKVVANLGGNTAPFKAKILNIIKPETGSPAGISKIIKLVEHTISKVNDIAGINSYNISKGGIGAKGAKQDVTEKVGVENKSKEQRSIVKLTIPLLSKSGLGSNVDYGYDYISNSVDILKIAFNNHSIPATGLKVISLSDFTQRLDEENQKYFNTTDLSHDISNGRTNGDTVANSAYTYLSPSRIRAGKFFLNPLIQNTTTSVPLKRAYRKTLLRIIQYNMTDKSTSPFPKEEEDLQDFMLKDSDNKDLLLDIFSPLGVEIDHRPDSLFKSLLGFIEDDSVDDDKKNDLGEEIGTLFEQEYNGKNLTPRKNPNTLLMYLLKNIVSSLKNKKPLEYYDFSKLVPKDKDQITHVDYDSMNSESHLYEQIAYDLVNKGTWPTAALLEQEIRKIPNQIKALLAESDIIASGVESTDKKVNNSGYFNEGSKDPKIYLHYYASYWFHYDNLVEIQYLAGYHMTDSEDFIGMPIWKTLNSNSYSDLTAFADQSILCRVQKYENKLLDIQRDEMLELPIYNEYFILNLS